jgi:hydrogenase maturation protease
VSDSERAQAGAQAGAQAAPASRRVAVIGVGNTLMRDDGVGVAVARRLLDEGGLPATCEVVLGETAGMGLVRFFREFDGVVFVDGIDAGDEPGSVFAFPPDDAGVTGLRSNNIHGMGVGYLLTCARMTGADPDVVCVAVQVGDVRPLPDQLTPKVAEAVPKVVALVRAEAERLSAGATAPAPCAPDPA